MCLISFSRSSAVDSRGWASNAPYSMRRSLGLQGCGSAARSRNLGDPSLHDQRGTALVPTARSHLSRLSTCGTNGDAGDAQDASAARIAWFGGRRSLVQIQFAPTTLTPPSGATPPFPGPHGPARQRTAPCKSDTDQTHGGVRQTHEPDQSASLDRDCAGNDCSRILSLALQGRAWASAFRAKRQRVAVPQLKPVPGY